MLATWHSDEGKPVGEMPSDPEHMFEYRQLNPNTWKAWNHLLVPLGLSKQSSLKV